VWHQVLSRESSRRLEVFCEKALLWTDDDYLGPLHVQTDTGTEIVTGSPPPWSAEMAVPEQYLRAMAPYAAASKSFLDTLAAGHPRVGYPPASEALAAHRLVDAAYRSAAAGGEAIALA
jgi:myo-inositol 2-dehydrogenase / D-chiro-inositol 1-dehydrogenase